MSIVREVNIEGRTIKLEFNKYAKQSNGSVMVSSGDTQVLVTVCANPKASADLDFFPLTIEYIEKTYAAGRIPGGYNKREGRPSDSATLTARVIDRPIRPCFPANFKHETVVTATVLSYEHGHNPAPLALIGASTALMISDIPFDGPVAAVKLGLKDDNYVFDPFEGEEENMDLDLNVACKPEAVLMVEAAANFLPEEKILDAINHAHKIMQPLFDLQLEIQKEIGKEKWVIESPKTDEELHTKIESASKESLSLAFSIKQKSARKQALDNLLSKLNQEFNPENDSSIQKNIDTSFDTLKSKYMRTMILEENVRIDQRKLDEIRPINCEINILKSPHGSSLFTRGETQALATATLASIEETQRSETLWNTDVKERFMLHYNFPPFSVGEARSQRSPGRREIGHGNLAKRALSPVIPSASSFDYSIRVVSETLESNGSSSMATVCAGTMAMMNAGIPVSHSVAGIAMGLVKEGDKYAILSDILGDEDHLGDMDFKVCGTQDAVTALQMDIKIQGITPQIMKEALDQAKKGRQHILGKMAEAIAEPEKISTLAPRAFKVKINPDKVRDVIGPSGKHIKKITTEANVKINVEDSGIVTIVAPDVTSAQVAKSLIRAYTTSPKVGDIYLGTTLRILEFGAFIELKPGLEGLCHISQLDENKVEKIESSIKIGDEILVKVIDIDKQGRIKLSRKDAMGQKPTFYSKQL